jgi:hypothetical protein
MTPHQPDNQPGGQFDADAELDHVIDTAMDGILAKLEAAFDPEAGLADIHARRAAPTSPAVPEPGRSGSTRLEEACDHIDQLTRWLAGLIESGQREPFAGASFLELARDNLVQLRAGLANRTMLRPEAQQLTADAASQLAQTDQILRTRHGTTLDQLASQAHDRHGALTGQVQLLGQMITRLYEPDGDNLSLQPAR